MSESDQVSNIDKCLCLQFFSQFDILFELFPDTFSFALFGSLDLRIENKRWVRDGCSDHSQPFLQPFPLQFFSFSEARLLQCELLSFSL